MKKLIPFVLATVVLASTVPALPCEIHITPGKIAAAVGRDIQVTVTVVLEHRNCKIPIDETTIEGKNIIVAKLGVWRKVKADEYSLDLTLVLNGPKGELHVTRECEKKGLSEGVLKVNAL